MDSCPLSNTPCPNNKKFEIAINSSGEYEYVRVCEKCAYQSLKKTNEKNLDILMSMIESITEKYYHKKCVQCSCTYEDILKKSRFGCDLCYEQFKDEILILIRKCQVSTYHIGKRPKFAEKHNCDNMINIEIEVLERIMKDAVSIENYEYASELKERIKKLQDKKAQNEI